ncbi:MAG: hypothetical protein AAGA17_06225 [Actinomycetota bacterium]
MRSVGGVGSWRALGYLALRRRTALGTWVVLAVVAAAVAGITTGLARAVERAGEDALVAEIARTAPVERGLALNLFDRSSRFNDPLVSIDRGAREALDDVPGTVTEILGEPQLIVDLTRFRVEGVDGAAPAFPTFLTIRTIDGLDERLTVVEGRPGAPTDDETPEELPIVEIGLSVATAEELDLAVGDLVEVEPDPDDLLLRRTGSFPPDLVLRVAEVVELTDPTRPEWLGDQRLHRPIVDDTATGADRFAFALIRPDVLPRSAFVRAPFTGTWVADVEADALTLASSDGIERALQRFIARSASSDTSPGEVFPTTQLVDLLRDERIERTTARELLDLALLGLVALSLLTVVLTAEAGARRSGHDAAVARGRGVSRAQLVVLSAIESLIVVGVAAAGGAMAANVVVDGATAAGATVAPALWIVAATVTTAVVGAALRERRPLGEALSPRTGPARAPARLTVASELVVVALALAGWSSLRRSGIGTGDGAGLLAVAAPLSLAALGVLALRRVPTRVARALSARPGDPGLGTALGLRRAEQATGTATALIGTVLLTAVPVTIGWALVDGTATDAVDDAGGPLADALRWSSAVVVLATVALAVIAATAIARLVVGDRIRQGAMLDAMGAPPKVATRAVSTELVVPGLVAAAGAGLLGVALTILVADRVDLDIVTGASGQLSTSWWVGAVAGLSLAVVAVGTAAIAGRGPRIATARLLRTEEGT